MRRERTKSAFTSFLRAMRDKRLILDEGPKAKVAPPAVPALQESADTEKTPGAPDAGQEGPDA